MRGIHCLGDASMRSFRNVNIESNLGTKSNKDHKSLIGTRGNTSTAMRTSSLYSSEGYVQMFLFSG